MLSKIFEHALLNILDKKLETSDNQMGFKKRLGCQHVIYTLKQISDYFTKGGSTVNICTLDIAKAFDKVNFYVLLDKLARRKLPVKLLYIFYKLFTNSYISVKWGDGLSAWFKLEAGVRQGGILSPRFFAIYVNDLLLNLTKSSKGCYINNVACNCIMYADDLILLSASLCHLQVLINQCIIELSSIGLEINVKKCSLLRVGKRYRRECVSIYVREALVPIVNEVKCLGVFLKSGLSLKFSFDYAKKKFYRSANAILSNIGNRADIVIPVSTAQCVPILLYCTECMLLNKSEKLSISHPFTVLLSKLFNTFDASVLEQCHWYMNCLPIAYTVDLRTIKFLTKLSRHENLLINAVYHIASPKILENLQLQYGLTARKSWRDSIWDSFSSKLFV
mgnify:FL=1